MQPLDYITLALNCKRLTLNCESFTDLLLKFPAFNGFPGTSVQNKREVPFQKKTVDFVDATIAVGSFLSDGEQPFLMNGDVVG